MRASAFAGFIIASLALTPAARVQSLRVPPMSAAGETPTLLRCISPVVMLWTAPPRARVRVSRDREHGFHRIVSKYFAGS